MTRQMQRERSALKRAVALVGGQANLARLCRVKQQNVHSWLNRQRIPLDACPWVEKACKGQVTCSDLRGDVHWVRDTNGRPVKYEVWL